LSLIWDLDLEFEFEKIFEDAAGAPFDRTEANARASRVTLLASGA
jgi:hypothetical protein